jgi:hypothetical protein
MRFSTSGFFHELVSPKTLTIRAVSNFFRQILQIFTAQGAPPMLLTLLAKGKFFNNKSFNYFV